ncbi:unnamed protein product [Psylliodes chrysocephalus]|uniref:RING-type domain-containing protein n=1 Tax=Psylliodes chrysocephalus TaxID=3402493 RepID=A0A9P0CX99_9CUCU|nr:unnamed protein product [Psylliodes chrysocephala]
MEDILREEPDISVLVTNFQINIIISCTILILVPFIYKLRRISQPVKTETEIIYNKECPICFNFFQFPIKSQCGHVYCMDCIYTYWEKSMWKTTCPLCRRPLKRLQILEDENNYSESTRKKLLEKIKQMSSKESLKLSLLSIPFISYINGILISLVWTLLILNMDKLIKCIFLMYKYLYNRNEVT